MPRIGQSETNVIMWVGIIIIVLISIVWLINNTKPTHVFLQKASLDVEEVQARMNAACIASRYNSRYNPISPDGFILINQSQVCYNGSVSVCRTALCSFNQSYAFDLSQITYMRIIRAANGSYAMELES
jgi:hypothetical protein